MPPPAQIKRHKLATILICLTILNIFYLVRCWDQDGHEAIGMTAMSALKGKALSQVKRLMNGKDVVDVAGWAHLVNAKYNGTIAMHFQGQATKNCELDVDDCPGGVCLHRALEHFYGRLTGKNKDDPDIAMAYPEGITLTDADAVKYLINLIGDMHQPLHVGFQYDNMGRNIYASFRNKKHTLYDLWDSVLVQTTMQEKPAFWNGGWTHVNSIQKQFEDEKKEWKEKGPKMFKEWMQDNLNVACSSIYKDPTTNQWIGDEFIVSGLQYRIWFEKMEDRLLVAGARTAIVLNSILETREAQSLRVGSGVSGIVDPAEQIHPTVGRSTSSRQSSWIIALGTNLCIVLIVLATFLYITKFYGTGSSGGSHQSLNTPRASKQAPSVTKNDEKAT
eukprot:GHVL01018543.1.p1 GENE.GHVL01018543.1~~GHVL01018543.1.p1  ORF type:complete len:390 (+),score=71.38 GHVL01018543.1:84-1253(+)